MQLWRLLGELMDSHSLPSPSSPIHRPRGGWKGAVGDVGSLQAGPSIPISSTVRWADAVPGQPHLELVGQDEQILSLVFGRASDGRALLASTGAGIPG